MTSENNNSSVADISSLPMVKTGKLYRFLRQAIRLFTKNMTARWKVPFPGGSAVFVVNHVGAMGPVDMCLYFTELVSEEIKKNGNSARVPVKETCRMWCNEGIMNKESVPAYVRQDYWWEPGCRLEKLYDAILPHLAAAVLPPVLKSAPTMPVYHDARMVKTMRESLRHLEKGGQVIIFPEQPSGHGTHHTWLNTGWMNICTMYQSRTGKDLPMYPVHIDTSNHTFIVGKPVYCRPDLPLTEQLDTLSDVLHKGINGEECT